MTTSQTHTTTPQVDAVIVGAGFAGLRTIHELRRLGMTMRVFEAGSDVGCGRPWLAADLAGQGQRRLNIAWVVR